MEITVPIPNYAAIESVLFRAYPPNKESFLGLDMGHRDRLDAEEDKDLVEGWEIGDEVREDGRDPRDKFSVYETDTLHTHNAKTGAKAEEPVDGNLVLDIKLVFFYGTIVPHIH